MNEGGRFFASKSAVLHKFDELARRACLEEVEKRKVPNLFDFSHFPKPSVSLESLEKSVENGLPLPLAEYIYDHQIEMPVKNWFYTLRITRGHSDSGLTQVRAKSRGEESVSKSEDQIEREASRWVNDLWSAAVEHQAAM
jgi:hypothetical protein